MFVRIISKIQIQEQNMISEYLMKGIDSLFSRGLGTSSDTINKQFNKDLIKSNLQFVVKQAPKISKPANHQNDAEAGPLNKSRLRTILEKNKQAQIKSVIRRDNSRSASPYQRISPIARISPTKAEGGPGDKIIFYRQQRKTIQKSRVLQKSRLGGGASRVYRVGSQLKSESGGTKNSGTTTPLQHKSPIRY